MTGEPANPVAIVTGGTGTAGFVGDATCSAQVDAAFRAAADAGELAGVRFPASG